MRSLLALTALALTLLSCSPLPEGAQRGPSSDSDGVLRRAFEQRTRNLLVEGQGVVKRILPDDNEGSRHQRFIVELSSGQTLLIAHNIDIAPRVPSLRLGDEVAFVGSMSGTRREASFIGRTTIRARYTQGAGLSTKGKRTSEDKSTRWFTN